MRTWAKLSISFIVAAVIASAPGAAQQAADAGATDREIRIGNIMPYTGPLAAFATIGRAEAAYFDMINAKGGINGRKIKFISRDDSSSPKVALNETRDLVETENVLLMFGSFGTPGNLVRLVGDALGLRSGNPKAFSADALRTWAANPVGALTAAVPSITATGLNLIAPLLDDFLPAAVTATGTVNELSVKVDDLFTLAWQPAASRVAITVPGIPVPGIETLGLTLAISAAGLDELSVALGPADIDAGGVRLRPFASVSAGLAPAGAADVLPRIRAVGRPLHRGDHDARPPPRVGGHRSARPAGTHAPRPPRQPCAGQAGRPGSCPSPSGHPPPPAHRPPIIRLPGRSPHPTHSRASPSRPPPRAGWRRDARRRPGRDPAPPPAHAR